MIETINLILVLIALCVAVITLTVIVVKITTLDERLQRFEDYYARRSQDQGNDGLCATDPDRWAL